MFWFYCLRKLYWWSVTICTTCSTFRHGLYHPSELLEVKAHWVVFSWMSYILAPLSSIWSWWGSLVQWKYVLACRQCPSRLAVSQVIIKSPPVLCLCWQTCFLPNSSPCARRDLAHKGLQCAYSSMAGCFLLLNMFWAFVMSLGCLTLTVSAAFIKSAKTVKTENTSKKLKVFVNFV